MRAQLIQALRDNAGRMAHEAQLASNATGQQMTAEQSKDRPDCSARALQAGGAPDLENHLRLRAELAALQRPVGPDWKKLAELIATPGVLDRFSDAQLRPLLLEYITQIRCVGTQRGPDHHRQGLM